jgi:hypothetical protein
MATAAQRGAMRGVTCSTRQGAIALIEAFLLWELRWTGESIQSCLQQLKAFLQSAA